ncbi:MAG: RadC family protein [Pirellula sp.]|jgi:DNA repair protein RadC
MSATKFLPRYQVRLVRNGHCKYEAHKLGSSDAAKAVCVEAAKTILGDSPTEKFLIVTLDIQLRFIGIHEISSGILDASLVHPREVFAHAILCNAASIILIHNHPSGDLVPSKQDLDVTNKLREVGNILGITVQDHIIVGHNSLTDQWCSISLRQLHPWP